MDLGLKADILASTASTYKSSVGLYLRWRDAFGVGDRPITEKLLCKLCWLFCHDHKSTGLSAWLSAIEDHHARQGWPPLPRGKRYKRTQRSIANIFGQIDFRAPAVPLCKKDLLRIRSALDLSRLDHAMFWLGCLLGFQALLRASEFCGGQLKWHQVTPISGGLRLCVNWSKTKRSPHLVTVAEDGGDFCIVQAFLQVLRLKPAQNKEPVITLSYSQFNTMLKRFYEEAVGDPLGISSHSLRRGGTTALVWQGIPDSVIMPHGRWTSSAWRDYIDLSATQQLVAARALLHYNFPLA